MASSTLRSTWRDYTYTMLYGKPPRACGINGFYSKMDIAFHAAHLRRRLANATAFLGCYHIGRMSSLIRPRSIIWSTSPNGSGYSSAVN
ncbi:hypothetical protein T07_4990 [Trichinella nelsoni]|uniref:Uncharacterized protein n=1 Tax=Trichinella nelsoni TaxID=6336 RepID=A0A0V0RS17_9BILA|nr:hypothetical protein T07_4990 [Trichinella nelsoni]